MELEIAQGAGATWGLIWATRCNQWGLFGVVILCYEGWTKYIYTTANHYQITFYCLQCFDTVGWVLGRASGL